MIKNTRPLTLLEQAQANDLILNDMFQNKSFEELQRFNRVTGRRKTSVIVIANNAHRRFFRRYQVEVARNPQIIH